MADPFGFWVWSSLDVEILIGLSHLVTGHALVQLSAGSP